MPQDQLLEESKDDVSLEEKIAFWVQKLTISMEKKAQNSVLQLWEISAKNLVKTNSMKQIEKWS